jgi:hypothetical protein
MEFVQPQIGGNKTDSVPTLLDGAVREEIDGRVEHQSPVQVAVRGHVGAPAGQSEAQRSFRTNDQERPSGQTHPVRLDED